MTAELATAKGQGQKNPTDKDAKVNRNFIFLYGSPPKLSVEVDTTMVKDVIEVMKRRIDSQSLTITFPDVFENLKGTDAHFEMVTSNTLQPLLLALDDHSPPRRRESSDAIS